MCDEVIDHWKPSKSFENDLSSIDGSSSDQCQSQETYYKMLTDNSDISDNTSKDYRNSVTMGNLNSYEMGHGSAISSFNGADCGEPFVPQLLVCDFTPRPGDEAASTKCMDFWNYVYSRPELKKYKVSEPVQAPTEAQVTSESNSFAKQTKGDEEFNSEVINWLTDDKVITETTFATMQRCVSYCDSYGSYPEDKDEMKSGTAIAGKRKPTLKSQNLWTSTLSTMSRGVSVVSAKSVKSVRSRIGDDTSIASRWTFARETALRNRIRSRPQTKQVKAMCNEMASFDEAHPRTFDPPAHPNVLHHAVLRKIVL